MCVGLPPAITAPLSRRTLVRSMFLFTMVLECEFIKMLFVIQVEPGTASLISASINQCPRGQSEYRNFFLLISEFSFACVRCIWQCPGQSLYHQCEAGKWSDQPGQTRWAEQTEQYKSWQPCSCPLSEMIKIWDIKYDYMYITGKSLAEHLHSHRQSNIKCCCFWS